jgi:hypothetical protein
MSELDASKEPGEQKAVAEDEDQDFKGFRKPDDTIH